MSRCNDKYLLSDTINDTFFFFVFLNWKGLLFLPTNHTRRIFMGLNGDGLGVVQEEEEDGNGIGLNLPAQVELATLTRSNIVSHMYLINNEKAKIN